MRIVACLCWTDEPPAFLDRLVRSLAGHVDALVAADGPWRGFEGAAASPHEQRDAIRAAAAEVDVPVVLVPGRRWPSQAAKRGFAAAVATAEGADWLLVIDGDSWLARCDDAALRNSLETTDLDVATVTTTYLNRSWPYSEMPAHSVAQRHLYRALPGLEYRHAHYGIVADGRWLNGDPAEVALADALDLSGVVEVAHDNVNRGRERNGRMRAYRKARVERRLEVWQ